MVWFKYENAEVPGHFQEQLPRPREFLKPFDADFVKLTLNYHLR